jgi:transcription initiation factor TFIID subunit 9B
MAIPRDARLLSLILASKGIDDADDRVLQQLLDFSYRASRFILPSPSSPTDP